MKFNGATPDPRIYQLVISDYYNAFCTIGLTEGDYDELEGAYGLYKKGNPKYGYPDRMYEEMVARRGFDKVSGKKNYKR